MVKNHGNLFKILNPVVICYEISFQSITHIIDVQQKSKQLLSLVVPFSQYVFYSSILLIQLITRKVWEILLLRLMMTKKFINNNITFFFCK